MTERPSERAAAGRSALATLTVSLAAAMAAAGVAFALWIGTPYFDGALDRAGSAAILGLPPANVHALSRSVVTELFVGDGEFGQTISGPGGQPERAFSATEASHFRDVQVLVRLVSAAIIVALGILLVGVARVGPRRWFWDAVARGARGLAVGLVVVGIIFAVAFEPAFTLFHLIFFPGGNWSFDPLVSRMVQLYPTPFWEEVVMVYAVLAVALAVILWVTARARARRLEP